MKYLVCLFAIGCGNDAVHHLADAPPGAHDGPTLDAARDAAIDTALDGAPPDVAIDAPNTMSVWDVATGTPDTACPSWTLTDTASPEDPVHTTGSLFLATDVAGENLFYSQDDTQLIEPANLVIEARMQFGAGTTTSSRSGAAIGFRIGPTLAKNILFIQDNAIFILTAESTMGQMATVPTTDAPHTYRIEVATATGAVTVFYDNVSTLTGMTFPEPGAGSTTSIFFGEASSLASGSSTWFSLTHNAHAPSVCP